MLATGRPSGIADWVVGCLIRVYVSVLYGEE